MVEYRVGSFNMEKFGEGNEKDFDKIAKIIVEEDLDVVALQEIFSDGNGIKQLFASTASSLYKWDFCLPERLETRGETYAYLWNKKKFRLAEEKRGGAKEIFNPKIVDQADTGVDCSLFARAPSYIRLFPLYGGNFELRLINVHLHFGKNTVVDIDKRKLEFDLLTQSVYPEICRLRYGANRAVYTIALGDYNLNIFSPLVQTETKNCYLSEVISFREGKQDVNVLTIQDQLTTLRTVKQSLNAPYGGRNTSSYANNYDHFTYSPELSDFFNVSCQTIDAVEKYCEGDFEYYRENISDHLPIVMTIKI